MEKIKLEELVNKGFSCYEIANESGLAPTTVRYWLSKFGLKTKHFAFTDPAHPNRTKKSTIESMPTNDLQAIILKSSSIKQVIEALGLNVCVYQYRVLRKRIFEDGLEAANLFDAKAWTKKAHEATSINLKDALKEDGKRIGNSSLKKKLLESGSIKNVCVKCDNAGEWMGEPITLQLDHINGLRTDNRLENLRLLCPNCHSQTPTWGSKSRAGKPKCEKPKTPKPPRVFKSNILWPSNEDLKQLVWTMGIVEIAKKLGVARQTVEKRCNKHQIIYPKKIYWSRRANGRSHEEALNPPKKKKGIKNLAIFSDEKATEIITRIFSGESLRAIGRSLNVNHSTISSIKLGSTYRHLPRPWKTLDELPKRGKYTRTRETPPVPETISDNEPV